MVGWMLLTRIKSGASSRARVRGSRGVVPGVRLSPQPQLRAGEDHRSAAPSGPQVRDRRLGGVPLPGQVDIDHVLPGLLRKFGERPVADDAGVGGHDVQPAEPGHPVVEQLFQRIVVPPSATVAMPPGRLDLLDRLGQVLRRGHRVRHRADLGAQIDRDDVRALPGQCDRVAAALAARGPPDEGDLAFDSSTHCAVIPFAVCVLRPARSAGPCWLQNQSRRAGWRRRLSSSVPASPRTE